MPQILDSRENDEFDVSFVNYRKLGPTSQCSLHNLFEFQYGHMFAMSKDHCVKSGPTLVSESLSQLVSQYIVDFGARSSHISHLIASLRIVTVFARPQGWQISALFYGTLYLTRPKDMVRHVSF